MAEIKPFQYDLIERSLMRSEWEKWLRAFKIYIDAEDITGVVRKRNKLLHLGGPKLQAVAYSLPGAIEPYDEKTENDVFETLFEKLSGHFSPERNSTFERHLFRNIIPTGGENFNQFLMRLRQQINKCSFGSSKEEAEEIALKDKILDSWAPLELKMKLLGKEDILNEIIGMCQVVEQINKQTLSMTVQLLEDVVHKINSKKIHREPNLKRECGRCGHYDHHEDSKNCPARNSKCLKCSRFEHYGNKCRTKRAFGQLGEFDRKRRDASSHRDKGGRGRTG
ncbi:hypothetical protein ACLKA7_000805 [Drosophila subpalustris]